MTPAVLLAAALVALQPSVLVDRSGAFLSTSAFNELRTTRHFALADLMHTYGRDAFEEAYFIAGGACTRTRMGCSSSCRGRRCRPASAARRADLRWTPASPLVAAEATTSGQVTIPLDTVFGRMGRKLTRGAFTGTSTLTVLMANEGAGGGPAVRAAIEFVEVR